MLYRLRDVPAMLATPVGRMQVADGLLFRLWPLIWRGAWLYRRTFARGARTIVVVGSFGKSTTARAVAAAVGLPANPGIAQNAYASVAHALLRIRPSQPRAVIEVGIGGRGEMARYASLIRPDVVVVTAIGGEHARAIGTVEDIREEKSAMLRALPAAGTSVVNGDDPHAMWMATRTPARVVTYGFGDHCDVRAADVRLDWPEGTRLRVVAFGEERDAAVRLIGRHTVYPVLAAIAVARVEGLDLDVALERLRTLLPTPGRMQPAAVPGGVLLLLDEFKATIETVHAALDTFAEVPARRRIVLMGNLWDPPGDEALAYREVGGRIATMAAHLVVVGRGLADYGAGATAAGMPATAVHDGGSRPQQAAAVLSGLLQPGDVVLVKGSRGQMLDRVRLILEGRRVGCDIDLCDQRSMRCVECPMLEAGWGARRMIVRAGARR
jgi:UDP-N-acetylmuramoyl-tripeptide--D-alanyl-D-alanine ligase